MNKLLIISGPTATGKTKVAISLAEKFNGELISADSRQIYRGLDIGTGKDHPQNIKIHLTDIVDPDQSFSVSQYYDLSVSKIKEIQAKNKLPIVVGGTGLYIDSIINPRQTFDIKPNNFLRFFLNRLPVAVLQKVYYLIDKRKYSLLNHSDVNNPYRLIRKIEIKLSHQPQQLPNQSFNILHISLVDSSVNINRRIDQRVQARLKLGLFDEISSLLSKYKWSDPGLNTLAYKEFKTGFSDSNVDLWKTHEHQYAKRQSTWFKKYAPDKFVDISKPNYLEIISTIVAKWYNNL